MENTNQKVILDEVKQKTVAPYWPDSVRKLMIEKSEMYQNPSVYQFGYYDGFQKAHVLLSEEISRLKEDNERLRGELDRLDDGFSDVLIS